jgi:hypothetical protein
MRARLLYTMVFIFCLSAFASPKNECGYPLRDSNRNPCLGVGKDLPSRENSMEVIKDNPEEGQDFSTFQLVKFLYI